MKLIPIRITGVNTAVCVLLLIMSIVSFDCVESPLEPIAPTYDIKISVPVIDTTQYFNNFVQDIPLFQFNPLDSTYSMISFAGPIVNPPGLIGQKVTLDEFTVEGLSTTLKDVSAIDGTMNLEFTNRIPIALSFQMSFLKWNSAEAHSDTLFRISPDSLIKAPSVNIDSLAVNPRISNIAIFLTGEQIDLLPKADSLHVKLFFTLENELSSVKFKGDDYIRTRSSFNARFTINKPSKEDLK
jgi:hypothetical protein